ncbi:hypothetical protein VY397_004219 [Salmonella enterica]|nr:hypothetical protein [Salmonella enterica]
MKTVTRVLFWVVAIAVFAQLIAWADESDRKDCEERVAKELNTTAVFVNGRYMVKGYGRFDGR